MIPTNEAIHEAQEVLRKHFPATRVVPATKLGREKNCAAYLKLECELPTGSFKPRGALYALSVKMARRPIREVTASSTGNHGAAVAYAAKLLGLKATIFLPENPNPVKRARIADLGAAIVERGMGDLSAAFQEAHAYSQKDGVYFLNDATDPDLPAGPATIAWEILDALPSTDAIYVPMGDTALIRGVAAGAKQRSPKIKIIGVQAENAASYFLSWKKGEAVETATCDTIADGLATRIPEAANVQTIRELVDDVCLVSDEQMLLAIRYLLLEEHIVSEPAGAAATAALMQSKQAPGKNIVLLVTGANIAPDVLRRAVNLAS
jgi:threonine dehydratase